MSKQLRLLYVINIAILLVGLLSGLFIGLIYHCIVLCLFLYGVVVSSPFALVFMIFNLICAIRYEKRRALYIAMVVCTLAWVVVSVLIFIYPPIM